MKKYCSNCQTESEYVIKSTKDLDNLFCPNCGAYVDKNSKNPETMRAATNSGAEKLVVTSMSLWFTIMYYIYVVLAFVGVVAYFFKLDKLVLWMAGASLVIYILQLLGGRRRFIIGLILIPLGAAVVYYFIDKTIVGAALGVLIVFALRHLFRAIWYGFLKKLIKWGNL